MEVYPVSDVIFVDEAQSGENWSDGSYYKHPVGPALQI